MPVLTRSFLSCLCLALLIAAPDVFAAKAEGGSKKDKPGNGIPRSGAKMGFTELVAFAELAIESGDPKAAIPLLKEIISRAGTLEGNDAKKSVQLARLHLGSSYSKLGQWKEAREQLNMYLENEPARERGTAHQILCEGYYNAENWLAVETNAVKMLELVNGRKETDIGHKYLLQAWFNLEKYSEALEMLPDMIQKTKAKTPRRDYQVMKLRCLFEVGRVDELIQSLPLLFRSGLRYDINVNLTLLYIGDALFAQEQYRNALAIYRLVMPQEELIAYQQKILDKMIADETEKTDTVPREALAREIKALKEVPNYDVHVSFRAGQIYTELLRYWEGVELFGQIYLNHSSLDEGQAACFQKVKGLFELGANEEAVGYAIAFLEKHRTGFFPRIISIRVARYHFEQKEYSKVLALTGYAESWDESQDSEVVEHDAVLQYMFGIAYFQTAQYDTAYRTFERVIKIDPELPPSVDSVYWKAMCRLLEQKYQVAYDQFQNYRKNFARGTFAPAALFRSGVCRFGLDDFPGAKEIFKSFIDQYPEDGLMPEALAMYADLLGADGLPDEAVAHYDRAFQIVAKNFALETDPDVQTKILVPATYAAMQAAQALKTDAEAYMSQEEIETGEIKYRLIIYWMERYMETFGEAADWAQGVYWIGKAQMELGEPEKAVQAYLKAVIQLGADPAQEGVASILADLAGMIRGCLPAEAFEPTVQSIREAHEAAQAQALRIRLELLLAQLDGTSDELGQLLLAREKTLDEIPPSALALMCSALLENKEYSRAQEMFDHFLKYEESLYRVASYELLAQDLYQQGKIDEALTLAMETLGTYGATSDTGWAQVMKGKVELSRGEYEVAAKTFNGIFSVREWRGPVRAEAMFHMAEAWQRQGNNEKAFAFYQRTYLLYKAYDDGFWAAEGYLRSAECLRELGREGAARNTYRAMLLDEYVRDLPQANVAKETLGPQETLELLAGSTNTMETVKGEVTP